MKLFRTALACLLAFACLAGSAACAPANNPPEEQPDPGPGSGVDPIPDPDPDPDPTPNPDPELPGDLLEYRKYDLKTYLTPFWQGDIVYNETVWFAGDKGFAPLMYQADKILSVTSYDLATVYEEETDYLYSGNRIALSFDSRIPSMEDDEYMQNGKLYFSEGPDISNRQVAVTYTHSDTGEWIMPRLQTSKFPETMEKLENGEELRVVFYGDSITVGANASGFVGCGPYAESYPQMVTSYMKRRFPDSGVVYINTAVGGVDSNWAANRPGPADFIESGEGDHFERRVIGQRPDLLFIAFGMNDVGTPENYKDNIRSMIERVRASNSEVEIMLVSTMNANPDTPYYNKDYGAYQSALIELSEEFERVGVSTVYNSALSVYTMGKRFRDCTGNNANHPNDFMMRIYAQTILYSLFGEDYIDFI